MTSSSARRSVELWFDFASTYSALSVLTAPARARALGVELKLQPMLLGPIFASAGLKTSPILSVDAKARHMWRDLQRCSVQQGLPFEMKQPTAFPQKSVLANRVALIAAQQGWLEPFAEAVYRAQFSELQDIGQRETVAKAIASAVGKGAVDAALAAAESQENKDRLVKQVQRAQELGVFGAPTFIVWQQEEGEEKEGKGSSSISSKAFELFWGQDRQEQALQWALQPWLK